MKQTFPKRFYKNVASKKTPDGFVVTLDGRTLKTPGKQILLMAREDHVELIAQEWDAQKDVINPAHMPLTRLMNVAVERTAGQRDVLSAEARRYCGTDLLCYRAQGSAGLISRQDTLWNPWLSWAHARGVPLQSTQGIVAIDQDASALDALEAIIANYDDVALTLYVHFTAVFGSAVLALAVIEGALDAGEAYDLSRLDALYQVEHWGEDEEAAEIAAATRAETVTLAQLI